MNINTVEVVALTEAQRSVSVLETNLGNEAKIEYVALKRLRPSPLNVRRKAATGIAGLGDSILAKGLLQNLVVHGIKGGRGTNTLFGVCAGQRRLAALQALAKAGNIKDTYMVPVKLVSEAEALAASLIENQSREGMHAADECQAFKLLVDEGRSVDYIAALFGVSALTVQRRLKLANVSQRILDLYREDGISTDQMSALALTDDHGLQERLWFDATQRWSRDAHNLRSAITLEEVHVRNTPLAAFVGLDVYEAAGGHVRRDLFSSEGDQGYIADMGLLQQLATDRLATLADEIRADGWKWIETRVKQDYTEMSGYSQLSSHTRQMTIAEKIEFDALKSTVDTTRAALESYENDDAQEADDDMYEKLDEAATLASEAFDEFGAGLEDWTRSQKEESGVFLILDGQGELLIRRAMVKRKTTDAHGNVTDEQPTKKVAALHSEKLCRRLTAHRTAAVQVELAAQPNVALAVFMHRMIPTVFGEKYGYIYGAKAIEIQVTCSRDRLLKEADDMADSHAWKQIEAERAKWVRMMPKEYADLMEWLLEAGSNITANLFAFCIAATVDSVAGTDAANPVNPLMDILNVNMATYWKPTRESYLNYVSKARLCDVVTSAVSAEAALPMEKMKKDEAAQTAERHLEGKDWLPEVLTNRKYPQPRAYGESADYDDEEDNESTGQDETSAE